MNLKIRAIPVRASTSIYLLKGLFNFMNGVSIFIENEYYNFNERY